MIGEVKRLYLFDLVSIVAYNVSLHFRSLLLGIQNVQVRQGLENEDIINFDNMVIYLKSRSHHCVKNI